METVLFLSVLVFALVSQSVFLLTPRVESEQDVVARRLAAYTMPQWQGGLQTQLSILRRKQYSRIPWLDAVLQRFDIGHHLAGELKRAGVPMRAGEFLFVQMAVATGASFASLIFLSNTLSGFLASVIGAVVGFLLPLPWLRFKRLKRLDTFENTLPDALDLIAGALRAGYGISHGLDLVAQEFPGPCGEEFAQVLIELNLGADLDAALARLIDRVESEDARLLATAVAVQRRTGGNLVEVLSQMTHVIRERLRMRKEVHVITTAPRVSGYVVSLLPVFTVGVMFFTSRYYIDVLFSESLGHMAMAGGGVLVLIGLYLNRRICQIDM